MRFPAVGHFGFLGSSAALLLALCAAQLCASAWGLRSHSSTEATAAIAAQQTCTLQLTGTYPWFFCSDSCTDEQCLNLFVGTRGLLNRNRTLGEYALKGMDKHCRATRGEYAAPLETRKIAFSRLYDWYERLVQEPRSQQLVLGAVGCLGVATDPMVRELLDLVFRAPFQSMRLQAAATLDVLGETSRTASRAFGRLLNMRRQAYNGFMSAVSGNLPTAQDQLTAITEARFDQTNLRFDVDGTQWCNQTWGLDFAAGRCRIQLPNPSEVTCAKLCALATPSVTEFLVPDENAKFRSEFASDFTGTNGGFDQASQQPSQANDEDHHFCTGYAESKAKTTQTCVLLSGAPPINPKGNIGRPVMALRMPAAVFYCAQAMRSSNIDLTDGSFSMSNLAKVKDTCENNLTEAFSSATYRLATRRHPTLKRVCKEECDSLVSQLERLGEKTLSTRNEDRDQIRKAAAVVQRRTGDAAKLGFGEICTRNVVQLVEADLLGCCAVACGWDKTSRTCAGWSLLSQTQQKDWWGECCVQVLVVEGSDRAAMCQSTEAGYQAAAQALPPRGHLEAFQDGDDLALPVSALVQVAAEPGTSPCRLECQDTYFAEAALVQCSNAVLAEWFSSTLAVRCGSAPVLTTTVRSPHACGELGLQQTGTRAASWTLDAAALSTGIIQGTCSLFTTCSTIGRAWTQRKSKMSNSTETLWRQFS